MLPSTEHNYNPKASTQLAGASFTRTGLDLLWHGAQTLTDRGTL